MQQSKVTVVGSANVDLVIRAERMPTKGETLIGETFDIFTGGKGFNQATAAARLGAEVTLIGRIGADPFADILRSAIESEHIDSRFVKTDVESGTGIATIVVEPDGDNSIIVVPRANMRLTPKDITDAADSIAEADVLLLQLETPIETSQTAINIAKANDTIVILDPAPARPLPPSLLAQVDILTPNATEAALLSGHAVNTLEAAIVTAETLQTQIATDGLSAVVLTLGEQGVLLRTPTESEHIPALSVDAVDTTGAGDAFSGALATALANGNELSEAVRFAVAAGAAAVTVLGATPSMPTREKIEAILAKSC
ncbi:MAG: ribokinase [Candidatus Poribacteria bacterium]|nr:ribokinase [Candidatus Poribacteria bacterium]